MSHELAQKALAILEVKDGVIARLESELAAAETLDLT